MVAPRAVALLVLSAIIAGAACGGGSNGGTRSDVSAILSRASQAMATRSFSPGRCSTCNSVETLQYAPPDAGELAHSGGHDAWEYNLIVGNRWFVSSQATRWEEGAALEHIGMVLSDPRVLLRFTLGASIDGGATNDSTYVVRSQMDRDGLIAYMIEGKDFGAGERDALDSGWGPYIGQAGVRFWIDRQSFVVSQMELDYPALRTTPDPEQIHPPTPVDPPPATVTFDYTSPVAVTTNPISMKGKDVDRMDRQVRDSERPILKGLEAYKSHHGVYPSALSADSLGANLTDPWPVNPYSGHPMQETSNEAPGDFYYLTVQDGAQRCLRFYGWDNALDTLNLDPSCHWTG